MQKLKAWDGIWIVSIANNIDSEKINSSSFKSFIRILQEHLWFNVKIWKNIFSDIEWVKQKKRAEDFNNFLKDDEIKMIWPIWGWAFTNEILPFIDWDLFNKSPKITCWYSDITALNNAIYAKTWNISYSWPTPWSLSPNRYWNLETFLYFKDILIDWKDFKLKWHDFYFDYTADKELYPDQIIYDWWLKYINKWKIEWTIVGWNLSTFSLLFGTEFMPNLDNKIIFIEECSESNIWTIRRQLMHLKEQKNFDNISWVIFWRINQACLKDYDITWEWTVKDFASNINVPVIMNAQFWHISPIQTFPVWWYVEIY